MRRIILLALAATLLTTACRMEFNVVVDLEEDGSGSLAIEIGTDDELRRLMEAGGEGFEFGDLTEAFDADEIPGASVSERTEGDMQFTVITVEFDDQAELDRLMSEAGGGGDGLGDMNITYTDDTVTVEALLGGSGGLDSLGDAAGDLGGEFDLGLEALTSGIADTFFGGGVIIAMPGKVKSHNADRELSDGRLQWDLRLDGSDIEIMAVSELGGGSSFPVWLIAVVVLVALAVISWALMQAQRRRAAVAAVEGAGTPPPPGRWVDEDEGTDQSADDDPTGDEDRPAD